MHARLIIFRPLGPFANLTFGCLISGELPRAVGVEDLLHQHQLFLDVLRGLLPSQAAQRRLQAAGETNGLVHYRVG